MISYISLNGVGMGFMPILLDAAIPLFKVSRDGFYAHPFGCGNTIIQGFKRWFINLIEDGHETRPYSPGIDVFRPPFSRNIICRIPCK